MPNPHCHERERQRQAGQQVPRREPEAEHRGRGECGHEQLRAERRGAEAGSHQGSARLGHRLRQPLAVRVPQPPQSREGEHEHRRPAQQPVLAVDEECHQPVGALEVAARKVRAGGALAGRVGGVRRRAAVERLVEGHVERHREQRQLHGPHGQGPARRPPERARRHCADHQPRRHELCAEPRQRSQQRETQERLNPDDPLAEAQRQQRRARERRARRQLGVDGSPVGQERRAQPDGERGAERPRVGCGPQRQPVAERHGESGDRREEQLHSLRASDRVGRRDQQREADPVRLVQPTLGGASLAPQLVGIELGVRVVGVLVEHVHVAVLDDRLRGQQVVRLVAAVLRRAERVQPQRRRVGGEQQQPEGEGATHRRRTLAPRGHATTAISSW